MAKNQKDLAESLLADEHGGWLSSFPADENEFDRGTLWRLGSWGIGSVGAVIIAILAYHSGAGLRHEQIAAADLARQSQQLQSIAKAGENETRRLASAIDTLNGDRDRLFARVTVLEQELDTVTGSISWKNAAQNEPQRASSPRELALNLPPPLFSQPNEALPSQAGMALPLASAGPAAATGTTSVSASLAIQHGLPKKSDTSKAGVSKGATDAHLSPPVAPVASAAAAGKTSAAKPSPAESSLAVASSANPPPTTSYSSHSASTADPPAMDSSTATVTQDRPATPPGEPNETAAVMPATSEPEKDEEVQKRDAQIVVGSIPATSDAGLAPSPRADIPVAHTDFGVDLGSASSIKGLRALWHGVLKSDATELASLRPIIGFKERNYGHGMQLRLVAGPLLDAAAAAKICAVLSERGRDCETTVFDGQRLVMKENASESGAAAMAKKPRPSHSSSRHWHSRKTVRAEEPAPPPPAASPPPQPSTFRSVFSH